MVRVRVRVRVSVGASVPPLDDDGVATRLEKVPPCWEVSGDDAQLMSAACLPPAPPAPAPVPDRNARGPAVPEARRQLSPGPRCRRPGELSVGSELRRDARHAAAGEAPGLGVRG